jgi:hypothetical protein
VSWKRISSSVTGRSHLDRNENGQDYCLDSVVQFSEKEFFIGLAADGAGSTTNGGEGAKIACCATYQNILNTIRQFEDLSLITENDIKNWIISSRNSIEKQAQKNEKHLQDYACTLLGSIIGKDYSIYFQIGDGGIVINSDNKYHPIFWPDQGEYLNLTFFITDDSFLDHLKISKTEDSPDEIALFTDGLQNLVLSYSEKTGHVGFFKPLFEALRKNPCNDFFNLTGQLSDFISSKEINERTDDDKTIILALSSMI